MKTKLLFLCVFLTTTSFFVKATEYVVYTSADLGAKVAAAIDGDVITLGQSDSILTQTALNILKRITVKAAPGLAAKPQLKVGFALKDGSSLRVEGVKFFYDKPASPQVNTDSKYGITAVLLSSIDSIKLINCEALNFGRGLIRADQTSPAIATIKEIVIDNCIITNVSSVSSSYPVLGLKTAKVSKISITNTTFINGLSAIAYSEETATPLNLLIDHVTIYNSGKTSSKNLINFKSPAGSTLAVTNSIIYFHGVTTAASDTLISKAIDFSASAAGAGALTLDHSIVCSNEFLGKKLPIIAPASTSPNWATYNLVSVDSLVLDANYKLTTYPTQISNIGDPRGYNIVNPVVTPKTGSLSVVYTGKSIQLSEIADVEIYSITGQLATSAKKVISLSTIALTKGIYIVKVDNGGLKNTVQKITIH